MLKTPDSTILNGKPRVVLDVDLNRIERLTEEDHVVGPTDTYHTVYVVDEDGRLAGVFVSEGGVVLRAKYDR